MHFRERKQWPKGVNFVSTTNYDRKKAFVDCKIFEGNTVCRKRHGEDWIPDTVGRHCGGATFVKIGFPQHLVFHVIQTWHSYPWLAYKKRRYNEVPTESQSRLARQLSRLRDRRSIEEHLQSSVATVELDFFLSPRS
jgi:hypothetical protein